MAKCKACGKSIPKFSEPYCIRCEHIHGEAQSGAAAELSFSEAVV